MNQLPRKYANTKSAIDWNYYLDPALRIVELAFHRQGPGNTLKHLVCGHSTDGHFSATSGTLKAVMSEQLPTLGQVLTS